MQTKFGAASTIQGFIRILAVRISDRWLHITT